MTQPTADMVAVLFDADHRAVARWLIAVPVDLEEPEVVDQIVRMAARDEDLDLPPGGMVYVMLRPADVLEDADLYAASVRTLH